MLKLSEFSLKDWLKLRPLDAAFKQVRNDIWLKHYCQQQPADLPSFLLENHHLAQKNIALIVAFEQPWALNWLLQMAKKNLINTTVLVFDNSKKTELRHAIKLVCANNGVAYLALPKNSTRHVNRSHGMAMSWIYENIVRKIEPKIFAFLDHDLIPVSPVDFEERLSQQIFFGRQGGKFLRYWSLWAGYSIYRYDKVRDSRLNFLYDFSRGLDTGGRNWNALYSKFEKNQIQFASKTIKTLKLPSVANPVAVEFIDERWVHIGGISYNDGFKSKSAFFETLAKVLETDANWQQYLA